MANTPQPFRQHHITRALKGAAAAGRPDATVEVRLPSGATITVGSGKPDETVSARAAGKGSKPSVRSTEAGRLPKQRGRK
jgi:hypothetical protein